MNREALERLRKSIEYGEETDRAARRADIPYRSGFTTDTPRKDLSALIEAYEALLTASQEKVYDLITEYVEEYEMREPDYTPNEAERVMINDAINGFLSFIEDHGFIIRADARLSAAEELLERTQTACTNPEHKKLAADITAFLEEKKDG